MITVHIKGPVNEAAALAQQVKQLASSGGKVLRHYINIDPGEEHPPCDVLLVEINEKGKPK